METLEKTDNIEDIEKKEDNVQNEAEIEKKLEESEDTSSESVNLNLENANTTNCLALTIQKDHKLVAVKNVFIRTIRMSWKVVVTTITLTLIKLFS